jgi:hypothetical protein
MSEAKYAAYEALGPFFEIIMKGLSGVDEVIIKVRANLDSKMVTRLFTYNPIAS